MPTMSFSDFATSMTKKVNNLEAKVNNLIERVSTMETSFGDMRNEFQENSIKLYSGLEDCRSMLNEIIEDVERSLNEDEEEDDGEYVEPAGHALGENELLGNEFDLVGDVDEQKENEDFAHDGEIDNYPFLQED